MNDRQQCTWTGASGTSYVYFVYELPVNFKDGDLGNYIYTKIENNRWIPIYIGQGDLGDRVSPNHHKANCISRKNASHVHVHLNQIEYNRLKEEKDLLAKHPESYEPVGCNEKIGG